MSRRKVEINMKFATYKQMQSLYQKATDIKLKIRYMAMLKFMEGNTSLDVAKMLYPSDSTVRAWLNRYNQLAPEGLIPQKPKALNVS